MVRDLTLVGASKVTSRGQVTLPQNIRDKYRINPGDIVYFLEEGEELILKKGPIRISR